MFVHNLPESLDRYGLFGIFSGAGRVIDTYIPHQNGSRRFGRYGFVRFMKLEDARRSIKLFNGSRIRGIRIHVVKAKPKRQGQKVRSFWWQGQHRFSKVRKEWRKKERWVNSNVNGVRDQDQATETFKANISGQSNEDFEVWLKRSLVCTTEEPRDLATLESAIMNGFGQGFKLSVLSSFKFLLTFSTEEDLDEALEHQEVLEQWFCDIKRWGIEEACDTRRVWLDIIGVPPHGWKWENFKQIAELWGRLICLGKSSSITDSFEVMRVLIATRSLHRIEAEILLTVLGVIGS